MDAVHLPGAVRADIIAHARQEAPRECCGLLVGEGTVVSENVRVRNVHTSPTRYLLDPAEHIATNRRLRNSPQRVIGFYHSHPHSPPVPSDVDRAEAYYTDVIWLIVSLDTSADGEIAAYRLTPDRVTPLAITSA